MASQGASAIGTGALGGLIVSAIVDKGVARLLPEIGDTTWRFRVMAALALGLVGTLAAVLAARRAVSIDPVRAPQAE
jgi:hypothetical protein